MSSHKEWHFLLLSTMEKDLVHKKDVLKLVCLSGWRVFTLGCFSEKRWHVQFGILRPFSEIPVCYLDLVVEMCDPSLASLAFFVHLYSLQVCRRVAVTF